MRRLVLISALASTAVFGACTPDTKAPENKPAATQTPIQSASPISSPAASPAVSPAKPGEPGKPPVKDDKNINGNVKPAETPKAK